MAANQGFFDSLLSMSFTPPAFLAAALYALNAPLSKLLLQDVSPR